MSVAEIKKDDRNMGTTDDFENVYNVNRCKIMLILYVEFVIRKLEVHINVISVSVLCI